MSSAIPAVSVLMPMRNAAPYVEAALASILSETAVRLEVIVVDDGSTDGSAAVVHKMGDPRIKLIPGPREGIAAAFNAALEASSGEIVMRCDADDLFANGRIAWQAAWLAENGDYGAVCGGFSAMRGRIACEFDNVGKHAEEVTAQLRAGKTRTSLCTWAVRTEIVRKIGGARPFFRTAEDIDLQLRIGEQCRVWFDPANTYFWRLHDASITHGGSTANSRAYFDLKAEEFQRQRMERGADDLQRGGAPKADPAADLARPAERHSSSGHLSDLLIGASWSAALNGDGGTAFKRALQAAYTAPTSLAAWRNLILIAIAPARKSASANKAPSPPS